MYSACMYVYTIIFVLEDPWWKAVKPKFQDGSTLKELRDVAQGMAKSFLATYTNA